jgi:hypothetical protein
VNKLLDTMKCLLLFTIMLVILLSGCKPQVEYSIPELKYQLIAHFSNVFWCDPDLYPIARPIEEQIAALEQFTTIRANTTEFAAVLEQLDLPNKTDYTEEEKLLIYREHKELTYAIQMTPSGNLYDFTLRVKEDQGESISGTITTSGVIKVIKRQSSINTCPICLSKGTLIDTPYGAVPVEQLQKGMTVWTFEIWGNREAAIVIGTTKTDVPASFSIIRVTLSDGRTVTVSPGHPTSDGLPLGGYQVGDILDGARILALEHVAYNGATYDILPSGDTGLYRANGILLKSTMTTH